MTAKPTRVNPNILLAVLALSGLAYAVLSAIVIPALPTLEHDLHTSETGVTWVLTAYLIAASIGTSILGRLGDMYGKQRVLVWTMMVLTVGTLLAAVAQSLAVLVVARALQGAAGGIYPLAFGIVRDEFPRERIAGSIGLLSAILGVGGGVGIVASGLIIENMSWHWLFWFPLFVTVAAAVAVWRLVPESPVRVPGRVNWRAALVMAAGISMLLLAISETTVWGWGSVKTIGLLAGGLAACATWIAIETRSAEPLVDMTMMRIRGVWTTNTAAFLLGAGMYASFVIIPQFAQLPKRTGFGYGASVVVSGLYLLPSTMGMMAMSLLAGSIASRYGSRRSLVAGSVVSTAAFVLLLALGHGSLQMLIAAGLIGIGIGLAFAALGNLIVGAVPPQQTGIATGMNTVMRLLGGALGGQLSATFIAGHLAHGLPAVTGFTETFAVSAAFLVVCVAASLLVPRGQSRVETGSVESRAPVPRPALAGVGDGAAEAAKR
ncbi:MAG TPA: MFS transporter [Solirubrobacteraceae bacterium]|nr:MFS transporter [Solirubrobacteraceae bacterium]